MEFQQLEETFSLHKYEISFHHKKIEDSCEKTINAE
jgi:hypothetical protein